MLSFSCPHCARLLRFELKFARKPGVCPGCGKRFTFPATGESRTPDLPVSGIVPHRHELQPPAGATESIFHRKGDAPPSGSAFPTRYPGPGDHVEFRLSQRADPKMPAVARSDVLVQGHYLLWLDDGYGVPLDSESSCGALSRIRAPDGAAERPARAWQSLDIVFTPPRCEAGAVKDPPRLSAWLNDFPIHSNVAVTPSPRTRHDKVCEPGPVVLLGNEDGVQFRNVWVLPLQPGE
jgi:hypothetical protein